MVADYDIWQVTLQLKHMLPLAVCFCWVKGHQNVDEQNNTIYGPFTRPAQLNIMMDAQAEVGRTSNGNTSIPHHVWGPGVATLTDNKGLLVNNLRRQILMDTNGAQLLEY